MAERGLRLDSFHRRQNHRRRNRRHVGRHNLRPHRFFIVLLIKLELRLAQGEKGGIGTVAGIALGVRDLFRDAARRKAAWGALSGRTESQSSLFGMGSNSVLADDAGAT